ncbi:MAG TPA: hypothetical protein VHQ86_01615 [Candidatus Saccharimonadia bacterium]|jgi:hypothetical protein|nr:hypothetical protein [Candidatus Saccharimonadia bacterium]
MKKLIRPLLIAVAVLSGLAFVWGWVLLYNTLMPLYGVVGEQVPQHAMILKLDHAQGAVNLALALICGGAVLSILAPIILVVRYSKPKSNPENKK